jgi:hypothetical protein
MSTNNEKIEIVYREYIPSDLFLSFKEKFGENQIELKIDKKMYFSVTGDVVADVIISISQTTTELIVQGLLVSVVYDSLKYSILSSWTAFKNYFQAKSKTEFDQNENRRISLRFQFDKDRHIEYHLTGDVSDDVIKDLTEKLFQSIKDKNQIETYFSNLDLKEGSIRPRIRIKYNPKTNNWEPVNNAELRRYLEETIKKANDTNG